MSSFGSDSTAWDLTFRTFSTSIRLYEPNLATSYSDRRFPHATSWVPITPKSAFQSKRSISQIALSNTIEENSREQLTMPVPRIRISPSASISSLAQLEALTRRPSQPTLKSSSQARKKVLAEQPGQGKDLQTPKQSDQRRPKAGLSRTSSWWTIATGQEFSDNGEVAVTPAESSCAYETDGWEGDDEMDDDDNDTEILEEKMMEAQEVNTIEVDEEGESHKNNRPSRDIDIDIGIPEETQLAPPVIPPASAEESKRSSVSGKKKGRARAGKSSHSWAWKCFLWCCVVERIRGRG